MKLFRSVSASLLLSVVCLAQANFGRISGVIEDAFGAAVTATNVATGGRATSNL